MTIFRYTIKLSQHVSAGKTGERGNVRQSHDILPGSVIRGALASRYLSSRELAAADEEFVRTFEGETIFGQAVPVGAGFTPLSTLRCKYHSTPSCVTWRGDAAIALVNGAEVPTECDHCGGKAEHGRGWRVPQKFGSRATRGALNDDESASTSQLYTREAITPLAVLSGRVITDEAWLQQPQQIRLGGQRSVFGAASWKVDPDDGPAQVPPIGPVALTLLSPAILVDEYGGPAPDGFQGELSRRLERPVTAHRSWVRTESIQGWHGASGLPKPHEWAIAAGSTFVIDGLSLAEAASLSTGIGLRRNEGFGEVALLPVPAQPAADPNQTQNVSDRPARTEVDYDDATIERVFAAAIPEQRRAILTAWLDASQRIAGLVAAGAGESLLREEYARIGERRVFLQLPSEARDRVIDTMAGRSDSQLNHLEARLRNRQNLILRGDRS